MIESPSIISSSFIDRSVKSNHYACLSRYSKFTYADVVNRPQSDRLLVSISTLFVLLGQLSILVLPPTTANAHAWLYNTLQNQVTVRGLVHDYSEYVLMAVVAVFLVRVGLVAWIALRNSREPMPTETTRSIANLLIALMFLQVTATNMPTVDVCMHVIHFKHPAFKVVGCLLLAVFPFELALHNILTFDFEYVRQNCMQGRCYRYLLVKSILGWFLCIVFYGIRYSGTELEAVNVILNLANFFAAVMILQVRIRDQTFFFNKLINSITLVADSIYLWQSFVFFIRSFSPTQWSFVNLDYVFILMVPLCYFLMKQLDIFALERILNLSTHLPKSRGDALLYLEALYYCFNHQREGLNRLYLFTSSVAHIKQCRDPYCLCFNLRYHYDKIVGPEAVKSSHDLYRHFYLEKKGKKSTNLAMFTDLSTIEAMKQAHVGTIAAKQDQTTKTIEINKLATTDPSTIGSIVSLESSEHFILVISSMLRDVTNHYSGKLSSYRPPSIRVGSFFPEIPQLRVQELHCLFADGLRFCLLETIWP